MGERRQGRIVPNPGVRGSPPWVVRDGDPESETRNHAGGTSAFGGRAVPRNGLLLTQPDSDLEGRRRSASSSKRTPAARPGCTVPRTYAAFAATPGTIPSTGRGCSAVSRRSAEKQCAAAGRSSEGESSSSGSRERATGPSRGSCNAVATGKAATSTCSPSRETAAIQSASWKRPDAIWRGIPRGVACGRQVGRAGSSGAAAPAVRPRARVPCYADDVFGPERNVMNLTITVEDETFE